MRRIPLFLGLVGTLGGIVMSSWFLAASSSGGGEPIADFTEAELRAYGVVMLVLFCVSLVATSVGLKARKASGLALIGTGGLSLILAVYGTVVWLGGGLRLGPFGLLVLLAGVLVVIHQGTASVQA